MAEESRYLLFVPKASGYELVEREGDPPAPGTELDEEDARYLVARLSSSPLPGDGRRCAFLVPS